MTNKTNHSKYWPELLAIFEEHFKKGEKCECGRKLPCRSKAIMMLARIELLLREEELWKAVPHIKTEGETTATKGSWWQRRREKKDER